MIWLPDDIHTATGPLSADALERLLEGLAAHPEAWESVLDRSATERSYASLHRDDRIDVWAILWRPGNDTGWHDHDTSSGAVRVVEGELVEAELRLGQPDRHRLYRAGEMFSFAPSRIHRLTCEASSAISIHVYSMPLWRLGQYAVGDDGALQRVSVTYADELRPLELAGA